MLIGAYGYDLGEDGLLGVLGKNTPLLDNVAIVELEIVMLDTENVPHTADKRDSAKGDACDTGYGSDNAFGKHLKNVCGENSAYREKE